MRLAPNGTAAGDGSRAKRDSIPQWHWSPVHAHEFSSDFRGTFEDQKTATLVFIAELLGETTL
jgi:hypothetical protein